MTAGAFDGERLAAARNRAVGFSRKPFRRDDLVDVSVHHLNFRFVSEGKPPPPAGPEGASAVKG